MRVRLAVLAAALGFSAIRAVHAQERAAAGWRGASLVGSTRIAFDATYDRPNDDSDPPVSLFGGTAAAVRFVSPHWQLGVNPSWEWVSQGSRRYYSGAAVLSANYLPLTGDVSRPYLGVTLLQGGATHASGFGAWGVQGGWIHFLSPAVALRAEARYREYSGSARLEIADVLLTFDPYIFGRANEPVTKLPGLGVFDAIVFADYQYRPTHTGTLDASVAPFLTRWLQVGTTANFSFYFDASDGAHYIELFGRGYLPISTRVLPFAEFFGANESLSGSNGVSNRSHGERGGVRTYLTSGVALDVALQWRRFPAQQQGKVVFAGRDERSIGATLTTQFRVARPR